MLRLNKILFFLFLFFSKNVFGNDIDPHFSHPKKDKLAISKKTSNVAPVLVATGNQIFCPGNPIKIVTDFTITDPDDLGVDAIYIQIASGYVIGQDILTLTGIHPNITTSWDTLTGKLKLFGISSQPSYIELIAAVKDVVFSNSTTTPTGGRTFSITVGQANYLPSSGHYYQYVSSLGITWSDAKNAAQASAYYGLQGYLATITTADEAQIAGVQALGAGWIGGSDEEIEGTWKWMTGPETGSQMVFTFWNTGEPNDLFGEDYAHITQPGVGITGSWNDMSNTGSASGNYQPKGYVVEYGGMPNDPILQISTSSSIIIPTINAVLPVNICGSGSAVIIASTTAGTIQWYTVASGGSPIASGNTFTTPVLFASTNYYVDAFPVGCSTATRTPISIIVNDIPTVNVVSPNPICSNNTASISATTNYGTVNWFSTQTGGTPIASGLTFTTPILSQNTTFYAEGDNNGCVSLNRTPATIQVYPLPNVADEVVAFCENTSATLNAGVSNATYLWSNGATTSNISVATGGVYSVVVTSLAPQNCSITKTITLVEHYAPKIDNVIVQGTIVTITTINSGDFEYSIDDINYQDSNIFNPIGGGIFNAYVREKNNCGIDIKRFSVLVFPEYFTPNNDGFNDTWCPKGISFYPNSETKIFDRFGKLITVLNSSKNYWDGTLNSLILPSDDYWFVFKTDSNSQEIKGHFSLKR